MEKDLEIAEINQNFYKSKYSILMLNSENMLIKEEDKEKIKLVNVDFKTY